MRDSQLSANRCRRRTPAGTDWRSTETRQPLGRVDRIVYGAVLLHRHNGRCCRFGGALATNTAGRLIAGNIFRGSGRRAPRWLALFQYRPDKRHGQTLLRGERRLIELVQ